MNEENKNNEEVSEAVDTPAEEATETTTADENGVGETVTVEATAAGETEAAEAQTADGETVVDADVLEKTDEPKKGLSNGAIAGIAAGVVVIIAAVVIFLIISKFIGGSNSYNDKYLDIDGTTAADIANNQCMEYDEFLEYFQLPTDLPEETNSNAVQNLIPVGRLAEIQGRTFEDFKEMCAWDDSITATTPYGEAMDKTALKYVVGEEQLDYFKQMYGLDDNVTADTKFGEIRQIVDEFSRKQYEDQLKQEEESEEAAEQETEAEDAAEDAAEEQTEEKAEEKAE